ncbi:hypothetical protein QTJ16_005965 [Diplocarpon rosae]|uniref:2EXR domain-containing protein n=1 Tax=Diplocarpon rosae TaxID=946125 RepID=A0AAD9SXF0_9HELO|nr:hypothetical protein QTJ16_005965 [Diplocarpon rosae]PBP25387.1 hypothetical protein BUE80_DR003829 [Diplocarpon rosae]
MDTFPSFSNLPSELRLKIWRHTFPEPRIVPVRFNRAVQKYTSNAPPPSPVHTCTESRHLFLKTYTNLILSPKYLSTVFVDFSRDTIYFDHLDCSPEGDLALDLAHSPHADLILSCAIDAHVWEVLRVFKYESLSEVTVMRNLRTLALVMKKECDNLRGLRRSERVDYEGAESMFVDMDPNTVGAEIRHVHFYVESLRWELKHKAELQGLDAASVLPNVQMWLL